MKLTSEKNNQKNSCSFLTRNSKTNYDKKTTYFSTNKNLSHEIPKKVETPLDFIKQKKKFNIEISFDAEGTKNFLSSKKEALMEIKLKDEIINDKINTSAVKNDIRTDFKKLNSKKNREYQHKSKEERNIDQRNDKDNYKENNLLIIDELNNYSKESNFFYKFIIENANETDEKFQKKLEKVIEIVKNDKKVKNKKEKNLSKNKNKVIKDDIEIIRYNNVKVPKKKGNIFIYSEKVKSMMENDDIGISSINTNSKKNNNIKNEKSNIIFGEKEREFINDNKKDSLVSILNEF